MIFKFNALLTNIAAPPSLYAALLIKTQFCIMLSRLVAKPMAAALISAVLFSKYELIICPFVLLKRTAPVYFAVLLINVQFWIDPYSPIKNTAAASYSAKLSINEQLMISTLSPSIYATAPVSLVNAFLNWIFFKVT